MELTGCGAEPPQNCSAIFSVSRGCPPARAAAQRPTGAGGRMSSLKWVPAATPSSLATVRADGALTFRLRIRSASVHAEIRA